MKAAPHRSGFLFCAGTGKFCKFVKRLLAGL